jgi:hypothetical protein
MRAPQCGRRVGGMLTDGAMHVLARAWWSSVRPAAKDADHLQTCLLAIPYDNQRLT